MTWWHVLVDCVALPSVRNSRRSCPAVLPCVCCPEMAMAPGWQEVMAPTAITGDIPMFPCRTQVEMVT